MTEDIEGGREIIMESSGDVVLAATVAHDPPASIDEIVAQIWSLEAGAAARESAAIDSTDSADKYRLSLESRELREEVRQLKRRHTELMAGESGYRIDTQEFIQP